MTDTPTDRTEYLPRELVLRLLAYAQQSPAARVCGLVGADGRGPSALWSLDNIASDPIASVAVDPEQVRQQHSALRAHGQTLWASFHSCPQGIASSSDIEVQGFGDGLRLIAALDIRGVLQLRCWRAYGGRLDECALKLPP